MNDRPRLHRSARSRPRGPLLSSGPGCDRLRKARVRPRTVGFGKTYPELWLNLRARKTPIDADSGGHAALRVRTTELVDAFHAAALAAGGTSDGVPGLRPQHGEGYYAAFIRDPDGNRIEAVTFLKAQE